MITILFIFSFVLLATFLFFKPCDDVRMISCEDLDAAGSIEVRDFISHFSSDDIKRPRHGAVESPKPTKSDEKFSSAPVNTSQGSSVIRGLDTDEKGAEDQQALET